MFHFKRNPDNYTRNPFQAQTDETNKNMNLLYRILFL